MLVNSVIWILLLLCVVNAVELNTTIEPTSSPSSPSSSSQPSINPTQFLPTPYPSSQPTSSKPSSSPSPPLHDLGDSWYYLTSSSCTFYGSQKDLHDYPSKETLLEAAHLSFKFLV